MYEWGWYVCCECAPVGVSVCGCMCTCEGVGVVSSRAICGLAHHQLAFSMLVSSVCGQADSHRLPGESLTV